MYKKIGQTILIILSFFELTAIVCGIINVFSVIPLLVYSAVFAYTLMDEEKVEKLKKNNKLFSVAVSVVSNLLLFSAIAVIAVGSMMFLHANALAPETAKTVVVLGCQVKDGRPSQMLMGRIDAAYEYLSANEDAVCIATGGRGRDESISEASAIKDELVRRGVDAERIYLEELSTNTDENLKGAAQIIKDNGLSKNTVIATDGFHQMRASKYAQKYGLSSGACSCVTPWYLFEPMVIREIIAVIKCTLLGY